MKYKVKNYKGNILESLRKFRRQYPRKRIVEAREARGSLIITAEAKKEKKSDYDGTPNSFEVAMAKVKALIKQYEEEEREQEEINELKAIVNDFTLENLKKREMAKDFSAKARALEKETKILDAHAKKMAELINAGKNSFYGIREGVRELGILVSETEVVAKQGVEYADIFNRLIDENILKDHPEFREKSDSIKQILFGAKDEMISMGLFDPAPKKTSPKATMYNRDPETAKFSVVKEGFRDFMYKAGDTIKDMFGRFCNWFNRIFFPEYETEQMEHNELAMDYNADLHTSIRKWRELLAEYGSNPKEDTAMFESRDGRKTKISMRTLKKMVKGRKINESEDSLYKRLRDIQDKDDDTEVPYNEKGRRPYFTCRVYDQNGEPSENDYNFIENIGFHVLDNAIEAANEYLSENEGEFIEIYEETEREDYGIVGEPKLVWSSEW